MDYQQTLEFLFSQLPMYQRQGPSAYKENLDNTIALMEVLGNPHTNFKSVHIAGTNGKGSVSHYLSSILQEAGYKTGLYTSPHLKDFRERIRINGEKISEEKVIKFVENNQVSISRIKPSFFEMTVALAFQHFNEEKLDLAVVEVGMGGRLDSTNIISPELSVITNIGLDHVQFLGNSKKEIAREKAGIIKENVPVVIGEMQKETEKVFIEFAKTKNSSIYFADHETGTLEAQILRNYIPPSHYLKKNIKTVLSAIQILKNKNYYIDDSAVENGIRNVAKNTGLMGRWQILSNDPLTICDIGHNEDGIKEVIKQIRKTPHDKLQFVFGTVNDKSVDSVFRLLPKDAIYYFCKADIPRGMPVETLLETASKFNLNGNAYKSVCDALKAAEENARKNDLIFIGGSTFVVAEVL